MRNGLNPALFASLAISLAAVTFTAAPAHGGERREKLNGEVGKA